MVLVPVTLAPALLDIAGVPYLVVGALLGMLFVRFAWALWTAREVDAMRKAARRLFGYSILYLFAVFALILMEPLGPCPQRRVMDRDRRRTSGMLR